MSQITVSNFLGRELLLPQDRLYDAEQGLWAQPGEGGNWALGLAEPAVLMAGGVRQVEPLVEEGETVAAGQLVVLVLTGKLKYVQAPLAGVISFPAELEQAAGRAAQDPYGTALFSIAAAKGDSGPLANAAVFAKALSDSDGSRNPSGATGAVSPTCKAVYQGIGGQRLGEGGEA